LFSIPCPCWWKGLAVPAGRGYGETGFPHRFTLDGHAHGAQRRDDHGASLGGPPPPWPSPAGGGNRASPRREGVGETGFPHMFTSDDHAQGAQRRDEHRASSGGPPPPWPSPAGGGNRAPPRREGIGETWFPHRFTLDGHAHGAQRRDDHGASLGGPPPPWPSPAGVQGRTERMSADGRYGVGMRRLVLTPSPSPASLERGDQSHARGRSNAV